MNLAVVLITCDRPKYTKRTIESFRDHNPVNAPVQIPVRYFHVDDNSRTDENIVLANRAGFSTIGVNNPRRGNTVTRRMAVQKAAVRSDFTHVLLLENDWECARPVPWDLIQWIMEHPDHDVYHLRLWHHFKDKDKFLSHNPNVPLKARGHRGRGWCDPGWTPVQGGPEPVDVGDIHWGAPPSVTRLEEFFQLHHKAKSERHSIMVSGDIQARCAQVKTNVFWHIGAERTPGFLR